jgi:Bardet-Biedl syndrome 5 protein
MLPCKRTTTHNRRSCRQDGEEEEKVPPTHQDALTAYYAANVDTEGEPVFNKYLGLTVESMPPDVTIQTLWAVI